MTTPAMPSPELYFHTIFAYQQSAALKSALDLELFTAIGDGAATVAEIAAACDVPERGVRILCDYLTTLELLTKTDGRYSLPPVSAAFLSTRSPAYIGGTADFLYSPQLVENFAGLTDTIRRGTAGPGVLEDDHPVWVDFARAMMPMMMPAAHGIAERMRLDDAGPLRVLDIAAGHGIFGIVIAQRNPQATIVGLDWGAVLDVALENAAAMGVADRYTTLPGSALDVDYGTDFDVVLLPNFLHHFDRETNVTLLRKVAAALRPGGRVAILEFVPDESRVSPSIPARFALVMMSNTPAGDAYTESELQSMLHEAGFTSLTTHSLETPQKLIVGVRS